MAIRRMESTGLTANRSIPNAAISSGVDAREWLLTLDLPNAIKENPNQSQPAASRPSDA